MNVMLVLAIYVVAIVAYVAFSRRRQAKAQEDRFAGLDVACKDTKRYAAG